MSQETLIQKWQKYHRLPSPYDPGAAVLEGFRNKIHDISLVVSNFQQRFTQWYNKRTGRWGRLFGGRFDSVIVDENGALARMMAYITLNPVRAGMVAEPAEYRWCGYAERIAKGRLQESERELATLVSRELGLSELQLTGSDDEVLKTMWDTFRRFFLGHTADREGIDRRNVADVLNEANKSLELSWPQRLSLKVRFASKGVAVGSQTFVEEVLAKNRAKLKYRREHLPEEARAWDDVYCLKKHRRWVG